MPRPGPGPAPKFPADTRLVNTYFFKLQRPKFRARKKLVAVKGRKKKREPAPPGNINIIIYGAARERANAISRHHPAGITKAGSPTPRLQPGGPQDHDERRHSRANVYIRPCPVGRTSEERSDRGTKTNFNLKVQEILAARICLCRRISASDFMKP